MFNPEPASWQTRGGGSPLKFHGARDNLTGIDVKIIAGDPNPNRIPTSYVERQHLTIWIGIRHFTRLTNAFSKKVENLAHAVSLHFIYYNLCLVHSSLTIKNEDYLTTKCTSAMAAGIAKYPWSLTQLADILD